MNKKVLIIVGVCFLVLVPLFLFIISSTSGTKAENEKEPVISNDPPESDDAPGMIAGSGPLASLESFIPNKTTAAEVRRAIGIPKKVVDKQAYSLMYYAVENSERTDKIYIENNTVDYTIETILTDNTIYNDFLAEQNGKKPSGILYNLYDNNAGFDLFVFSEDGIAFLAHEPSGYVAEIHRFAPTVYQVFFSTLAPRLTFD